MSDLDAQIRAVMAPVFNCAVDAIPDSARINKFAGWDSLGQMKLVLALEEAFATAIPPNQAMRLMSFKAIRKFLKDQASEPAAAVMADSRPATAADLKKRAKQAFQAVGLGPSSTVLVHSFIGPVIDIEGAPQALIEAFREILGGDGTLVMPAFTEAFTSGGAIDRKQTPSDMGVLTDYFLRLPDTLVSPHPYHRFAAQGRHARRLTEDHSRTSFGPDSPMAKMHALDGKILLLSVDWDVVTFFHYIEERVAVPYRESKAFTGGVTVNGVTQQETWNLLVRPRGSGVQNNFAAFGERLRRAGFSRSAEAGPLAAECADMKTVFGYTIAALEQDPYCLVSQE